MLMNNYESEPKGSFCMLNFIRKVLKVLKVTLPQYIFYAIIIKIKKRSGYNRPQAKASDQSKYKEEEHYG